MAQAPDRDEQKGDMTSMIDVVFLMIIFFVCIDFKVLESKLDAFLPADNGGQPRGVEPVEQLIVKVEVVNAGREVFLKPGRYSLEGHQVRWQVGPTLCADMRACERELQRVADDPSRMVPDKATGGRKRMTCVVEGYPGTRYDDIARAADLCHHAGFEEIQFGGGLGPE